MADTLDRADPAVETRLALGEGHVLEVIPRPQAALVTVRSPGSQVLLSFEVVITPRRRCRAWASGRARD